MRPGFIKNPFDPRDVWEDELSGLPQAPVIPIKYRTNNLGFEPQGPLPICVSMAVTKASERLYADSLYVLKEFSQPHLFFHAGGVPSGSTFRGNLDVAVKRGMVNASACPMPSNLYLDGEFDRLKKTAFSVPFANASTVPGYARIETKRQALKEAILKYKALIVGVYAGGGWWKDKTRRQGDEDNHAVLLTGWDEDDSWWVFDSLQPTGDFDGYHRLSSDYPFWSCYAILEIPKDWKKQRDEARAVYPGALAHYGKPRDFELEQAVSVDMLAAFRRLSDEKTLSAAGPLWTTYINAVAYGGYNVSYRKWLKEMPGDIINDAYSRSRTGRPIFDFDRLRSEYP